MEGELDAEVGEDTGSYREHHGGDDQRQAAGGELTLLIEKRGGDDVGYPKEYRLHRR